MKSEQTMTQKILCLALFSGLAFAVSAQAQESDADDDEIEVIEVIGYRDSLKKNLSIKRGADTVVDAISARPDISLSTTPTKASPIFPVCTAGRTMPKLSGSTLRS